MSSTRRALAIALAALALPAPAHAVSASAAEVRQLATRAIDDPAALSQLREVDRVGGQPADIRGALRGARGKDLEARLRELAATPDADPGEPPRAARTEAADILSQSRFDPPRFPRPFKGALEQLAEWSEPVREWFRRMVPGGSGVAWSLLAALVLAATAVATQRSLRGRAQAAPGSAPAGGSREPTDPSALEKEAARAEADGRLEDAVRLRFRAGLLRLDSRDVIDLRDSLPTSAVSRQLRSPTFDGLARAFSEIAYGGRRADQQDVDAARSGWRRVLQETR